MLIVTALRRAAIAALIVSSGLSVPSFAHDGPHEGTPEAEVAAATLTNQMIGALRSYQRAAPQARARFEQQLGEIAARREALLYSIVEKNPKAVLLKQIPPGLRDKMPASVLGSIEQEVDATGELLGRISDDFTGGRSRQDFFLEVLVNGAKQRLNVNPADASLSPDELTKLVGSTLKMRGLLLKDHLVVADRSKVELLSAGGRKGASGGGGTSTTPSTDALAAPVDEKTLVLIGNFQDKNVPSSCTRTDIATRLFSADPSVQSMNRLYQETSRQLVSFSGEVHGPYLIPYSSTGACDYTGWGNALKAAAQAAGVNLSGYRRISYAVPSNGSCGWSGLAYLGGSFPTQSWIASCGSTGVFVHELGHNLRFHHASTLTSEYGDGSDPMGGARMVQFNASNRVAAGWQPAGTVVDASSSGSFALTSLSLTTALTPQVVRVRKTDTNEYYYLSLRTANGFDTNLSGYKDMISVHRSPGTLGAKTYVLQSLAVNQSFSDSANGITITPTSISGGGATVMVTMNTPECTTASPSIAVAPISQSGSPGATKQYGVTVTNRNGSTCASSAISLAQSLPGGFGGTFSPSSVTLAPGGSASATWSVTSAASASDGSYPLSVTATDSAAAGSAASAEASYVVFADSTPPVVSMLSPANGSELKRGRITLSASASDSDGIARVEFYVGNTRVGTSNSSPYRVNWNARKAAPGAYMITARAFDNAGYSADASVSITLK